MSSTSPKPDQTATEWLDATLEPAKGVVLLVHGLNNNPKNMLPLAGELRQAGYHTLILGLSGHRGEGWAPIDYAAVWKDEAKHAIETAKARFPELPLFVSGYSLGATVLLNVMSESDGAGIERAVMFAPAVRPAFFSRLLRIALPLRHLRLKLPTMVPKQWRANNWTPVGAYYALAELALKLDATKLRGIPMCFILDPDDELVSYEGTLEWLKENKLSNIEVRTSSPETTKERNHIIFAPEARGEASWRKMIEGMLSCLQRPK